MDSAEKLMRAVELLSGDCTLVVDQQGVRGMDRSSLSLPTSSLH
jgi:hypothetical protein